MKTPKIVRPHKITIFNVLAEEIDYKKAYASTVINNVAINTKIKTAINQKTPKANLEVADTMIVTIDLSDAPKYQPFKKWDANPAGFTVHPTDDYIVFDDVRYSIIAFTEIIDFSSYPDFVELICQRI